MKPNQVSLSWNRFWFEPQSPLSVSMFRIFFGTIMLVNLLIPFREFYLNFFGINAVYPTSGIDVEVWKGGPAFDILLFFKTDAQRLLVLYFSALMAFFVAIGFATRITTILLFLCFLSLSNHFPMVLLAGDNFARLLSLFLCFSPCGERVSVDALLKWNSGKDSFEPWAQRLMQVQLCFIYLVNDIYKLAGQQWINGSALYYSTRLLEYTRNPLPPFLDSPLVSKIGTWLTLFLEGAFVIFLWPRRTRYLTLAMAVVFHLGLDWCFSLGVFEWYFIATLVLFVDASDLERLLKVFSRRETASPNVSIQDV